MRKAWRNVKGCILVVAADQAAWATASLSEFSPAEPAPPLGGRHRKAPPPSTNPSRRFHEFLRAIMAPAIVRALVNGCDFPNTTEKGE